MENRDMRAIGKAIRKTDLTHHMGSIHGGRVDNVSGPPRSTWRAGVTGIVRGGACAVIRHVGGKIQS